MILQHNMRQAQMHRKQENSTDHRTNILAYDIGKIGIGFTEDGYYWSQLFTDNNANTGGELSGDLGAGNGSSGSGGNTSGDKRLAMEIPFYQYHNYFEVGYTSAEAGIWIPVNNIGDYALTFKELNLFGGDNHYFNAYVSAASIPVNGSAYIIVEPMAGLPVGAYSTTVEFRVEGLDPLQQDIVLYIADKTEIPYIPPLDPEPDPVPDFEIPDIYPEPDLEVSPAENVYNASFYGDGIAGIKVSSTSQNEWYYDKYGETKVVFQLSKELPQGIELEKVTISHFGTKVDSARIELDKSKVYVTFDGLPYSGQMVDVEFHLYEANRVILQPTPITVSVLINGEAIKPGEYSPFVVEYGDTVELLIPELNSKEYGAIVKNAEGEILSPNKASSYGSRSSGIYVIKEDDIYLSIGEKQ